MSKTQSESVANFLDKAKKIPGLKFSTEAMQACGMQPELASHMLLQNQAMGINVVLRAGSPPVYNQKRGPKTGFTLSKTSKQGFFKGSLPKDTRFGRTTDVPIDPKNPKKGTVKYGQPHNEKDADHLNLSIKHPDYLHTVPLSITMQDILRETGPNGDLIVLGYDTMSGNLRLAYRDGKSVADFKGQFVINLTEGDRQPVFYSRPWDRPDHDPNWDPDKQVITQPEVLSVIPPEIYEANFNHLFTLGYTEDKLDNPLSEDIKTADVFANTPRTSSALREAILNSGVIAADSPTYKKIANMGGNISRADMLALLDEEEIKAVYDSCALITTGDWDGLVLGHPPELTDPNFTTPYSNQEKFADKVNFSRVYNTFSQDPEEKENLVRASWNYLQYLRDQPKIKGTALEALLNSITEPSTIFSEFAVSRAGCITAHEFVYEQFINYSYRDEINLAYGNEIGRDAMQKAMDAALNSPPGTDVVGIAIEVFQTEAKEKNINSAWAKLDQEYLLKHLDIALNTHATKYTVPNINHDCNVHDLFQHGFDMRNPYGSNLDGEWLMITNEGAVIYGCTQEQLVEVLLIPDFLENNVISVSHGADMSKGWARVIERQLALGQIVEEKTLKKYEDFKLKENAPTIMGRMKERVATIIGTSPKPARQNSEKEPISPILKH